MSEEGQQGQYYHPVRTYIMNPKAVSAGELYGEVNPFTMEWRDGLMGIMMRTAVQVIESFRGNFVFDLFSKLLGYK